MTIKMAFGRSAQWRYSGLHPEKLPGANPVPQEFNVVIERDADGMLVASVPSLPGCDTQASSREELMDRIKEAIALHLDDRGEPPETLEFVAVEHVSIAA
jgi:predicted RNase H-like HicB family nuclease